MAGAIVAVFAKVATSAAIKTAIGAVVTAAFKGAVVGAVVGAATAAIKGDNVVDGALSGAKSGAIIGGALSIAGQALGVGKTAVNAEGTAAPTTNTPAFPGEAVKPAATEMLPSGATSGLSNYGASAVQTPVAPVTPQPVTPPPPTGILNRAANFVEQRPNQAMLFGQTLSGAAQGLLSQSASENDIEAMMERDRLNNADKKIDLSGVDLSSPSPKITGYRDLPRYKWNSETGRYEKVK